ncbi:MAG: EamA family transporter [Ginsengibacter sp.]
MIFAILWASASTATKLALDVAQPLVIAQIRFAIGGCIMLFFTHIASGKRLPKGKEWKQLFIYGLLNITIYLGLYVFAMQDVTAGVGSLSIATNPVFISFLSIIFLRKKLKLPVIIALILGTAGVFYASLPLLKDASVTTSGLILLLVSMLSYSVGAVYFSARNWSGLCILTINGWQTILGGMMLLPFTLSTYLAEANQYNAIFWGSTLWLAVPVSIFAVLLWLWLLRINTVKAGLWLFLCPVFGFAIAAPIMGDPISQYTIIGVILVMIGLFLSERGVKRQQSDSNNKEQKIPSAS